MTDRDPNDDEPVYQVDSDDGLVARERKKMILESRKRVNDIRIETSLSDGNIRGEANPVYIETVRSFLRNIEPLLANSQIKGSNEAYNEAFLGSLTIVPPVNPNTKTKPDHLESSTPNWARNNNADYALHRFSDPVEPVTYKVIGLKELLDQVGYNASWSVTIDKSESPSLDGGGIEEMTVVESKNWTHSILNKSVRVADQFLENANVGFKLGEDDPEDGFLDL